jgi:hypothetical protein
MVPQFTTGVFNQKRWPRAGDPDECWMLADLMALHSVAPWLRLPSAKRYRAAAGNPDEEGPTPGTVRQSRIALETLYPTFRDVINVMKDEPFSEFLPELKSGRPASISVLSGALPGHLQFGFTGNHRVTVFWTGEKIRLANPLARAHSRSKVITEDELHTAVAAHPFPRVWCVLMPTLEQAFQRHPLLPGAIADAIESAIEDEDDSDAMEDTTP